ncbi:MAG: DEAD/DEAH box helicase, partial [Verrucomicrobiota bacterium]|nr:DEAD/DEAH box helicase [Verrucomicrobiota bacterium]
MWTAERRAQQISDARRLVEMAAVFAELGETAQAVDLWRRAGDLFEWLARSRPAEVAEAEQFVPLTLLGAAAFHLAGLPAMASALLAQARPGIPAGAIFAAFLRADFAGVLRAAADFWVANPDFTQPAAESVMTPDDPAFLGVELVRSLGLIAAALHLNQVARLDVALARLRALARVATRARTEDLWLVMELTAQVAERFAAQSLWRGVTPLWHRMPPGGQQRLAAYVSAMFASGRGLLWPSQREGVTRLEKGGSFALCTPTGSGKTTIAELALLDALYADAAPSAPLAIYLVPSRALAAEVEARLATSIGRVDTKLTITGLYGGTEWSLSDAWVTAGGPTVLVSTVEMAEALMRHLGPLLIPRLALVVVDEAHQVQFIDTPQTQENLRLAENRAARLEQFLMRLFACAPQSRALALSAVAGGVETAIACWMSRDEKAEAAGSCYRSTRQLIGALDCRANHTVSVRLERLDGSELQLAGRDDAAYIPVPFAAMPKVPSKFRSDMGRFARAHSLWAALQIAAAGRTVLVSVTRDIDAVAADFRELLEEVPKWVEAKVNVLRTDGAALFEQCAAACEDYCGSDSNELFLLRRGIAVHHGQLPMRVRRLMTDVIRAGATPVALATSTLTEGVNLPFDVVIVPSILRKQ